MDDKQSASSWDDLIKEIGAAPAPDALERKRPAIETHVQSRPAPAPAAKPKPGDWNALASDLGLEVTEPEHPSEPPPAASRSDRRPRRAEPTPGEIEAGFSSIAPMESVFEDIIEEEIIDVEFTDVDDDIDDEGEADDAGLGAGDEFDPDDPSSLSGEAARSAFEALFQAGSFNAIDIFGRSPAPAPRREPARRESAERDPARRDPPRREGSRREESRRDSADADPAAKSDGPDRGHPDDRPGGGDREEGSGGDEEGRPRRRRRRRGRGRGRGAAAESGADAPATSRSPAGDDTEEVAWDDDSAGDDDQRDEAAGDAERDDESRDERPRRRRRSRSRGGRRPASEERAPRPASVRNGASSSTGSDADVDEDEDDDDDDDLNSNISMDGGGLDDEGDDDDDDAPGAPRASHKNIPAWADAIDVMVEANMQSRKNAAPRSGAPRGRGGRGGGRGGRGGGARRPPRPSS